MTNMDTQYDNALLGILQNEGKLEKFLDVIFGFLMRRTDFFYIMTPEQRNIGFSPGVSIQMILKVCCNIKIFCRLTKNTKQYLIIINDVVRQKAINQLVSLSPILFQKPSPQSPKKNQKIQIYLFHLRVVIKMCVTVHRIQQVQDPRMKKMSQEFIKQIPIAITELLEIITHGAKPSRILILKLKFLCVPESVMNARCVSVNIERKHIRISIRQNGKETVYFDRDLCWDIHKNDAMWTFHSKENQIHLCLDKIQERWWEAAFDGEDKINTRKIDCSRPMHELDDEAQAKIQQLMYDEQRKRQGLLTSEQEKIQNILASAWNKEGSPFQGTQYDPTKVKLEGSSMHIQT
ncbi:NudC domain-containing protein 3 [Schistosoma japonicum]|nr:NudC domain-containing protein 3 [Schistosoma japonicum]KAH8864789.1 NudC domain-containing protein 3 [Schistosoma japonicum]